MNKLSWKGWASPRLLLTAEQVYRLVNYPEFPSLYQLLPPPGEPFVWSRDVGDALIPGFNIYDPSTASRFSGGNGCRLEIENLRSAARFQSKLDAQRLSGEVRYFFFVGTQERTATAVTVRGGKGSLTCMSEVHDGAGDGTVPTWSGTLTGFQSLPVPREHATIYKGTDLKRFLAILLGRSVMLESITEPEREPIEVSVRDKVRKPGETTLVTVTFPRPRAVAEGELKVVKIADAAGVPMNETVHSYAVHYSGGPILSLAIEVEAPTSRGLFELRFASRKHARSSPDDFLVQSTGRAE